MAPGADCNFAAPKKSSQMSGTSLLAPIFAIIIPIFAVFSPHFSRPTAARAVRPLDTPLQILRLSHLKFNTLYTVLDLIPTGSDTKMAGPYNYD